MRRTHLGLCFFLAILVSSTAMSAQQADNRPAGRDEAGPRGITLRGMVRNSEGQSRAGTLGITFTLYASPEGGESLWHESATVEADEQGRFSFILGSTAKGGLPLEVVSSGKGYWLGIKPQGEEEQPRIPLPGAQKTEIAGTAATEAESLTGQRKDQGMPPAGKERSVTGRSLNVVLFTSGTENQIVKYGPSSTLIDSAITETGGNVGIGTTSPNYILDVAKAVTGEHGIRICNTTSGQSASLHLQTPGGDWRLVTNYNAVGDLNVQLGGADRITVLSGGNVGLGTTNPGAKLEVAGSSANLFIVNGSGDPATMQFVNNAGVGYVNKIGAQTLGASNVGLVFQTGNAGISGVGTRMVIQENGNVGIGTTSPQAKLDVSGNISASGNLSVAGNIAAKYQDLAEWVLSDVLIEPAEVVIIDSDKPDQVLPATEPYDTRVAGVISSTPGIVLGEAGPKKVKVATTGRVRVKVDATRSPIRIGDLLVTSGISGFAARSEPVEIGGVRIHRPGTVLGKALEPLGSGRGEILVLLSLQ